MVGAGCLPMCCCCLYHIACCTFKAAVGIYPAELMCCVMLLCSHPLSAAIAPSIRLPPASQCQAGQPSPQPTVNAPCLLARGLETLVMLAAWKLALPRSVFLLRGNHESATCTLMYGFKGELTAKYGKSHWRVRVFILYFGGGGRVCVCAWGGGRGGRGQVFCSQGKGSPRAGPSMLPAGTVQAQPVKSVFRCGRRLGSACLTTAPSALPAARVRGLQAAVLLAAAVGAHRPVHPGPARRHLPAPTAAPQRQGQAQAVHAAR